MFAAKFVEICKEENGYSVEVPVGLHLGETQYKTYVFPTYREASEFIGKAIGVAQEEIYTYSHDGSLRAWRETVNMVEREPSKDELRDELGEMRRKLERRKEKIDELTTVNAQLVKNEQRTDQRYDRVSEERDELVQKNEELVKMLQKRTEMLTTNGINVNTGKKLAVSKKAPRKR